MTAPATGAADRVEAVQRIDALWIVFSPADVPQPHTCRLTHDDAMQACFGRYESGRYPGEWWQHNLDEGWTCREVALTPPSSGAGAAGLEVERLVSKLRLFGAATRAYAKAGPDTAASVNGERHADRLEREILATIARQADDLERLRGAVEVPEDATGLDLSGVELAIGFLRACERKFCSTVADIDRAQGSIESVARAETAKDAAGDAVEALIDAIRAAVARLPSSAHAQIARPSADQREGADEGAGT